MIPNRLGQFYQPLWLKRKMTFPKMIKPMVTPALINKFGNENDYFWWGIIAAAFFAGHQAVECHMDNPEHARHLFEAYEQGELLGEGAFGSVYAARDRRTGAPFALKVMDKHRTAAAAFRKEVAMLRAVARLGAHPHVVGVAGVWEDPRRYYLLMELVSGGELFEHLIAHGAYSEADAARLLRGVASALAFLHSAGIVHLDVKPENLMLSDAGPAPAVKLIDFGSASRPGRWSDPDVGTRAYWPPETQTKARVEHTAAIDLWGLGVVMYILLVGAHPFDLQGQLTDEEVGARIMCNPAPTGPEHCGASRRCGGGWRPASSTPCSGPRAGTWTTAACSARRTKARVRVRAQRARDRGARGGSRAA